MTLPRSSRIVIVGGGIAGCSTAYHLAALGEKDVLLLEQGKLTCGTTWHAAGLVGQMRPNRTMTRMSKYGIELYRTLEAETGLATGWKQCGSVNVAKTRERMMVLRKQLALARSFGVECEEIGAAEAGALFPPLRTDDLAGAIWIPGDGKANPADLTMSLAKGARTRGVRIVEDAEVVGACERRRKRRARGARRACPPRRRRDRDRLRERRQLRRPVGAPARHSRRRQRAALVGRALLHRHRQDRRRAPDAAGAARSRRLHLLQGRSRRPADGRVRAESQAVAGRPDPGDLPVPAARRGLGAVRALDDGSDPSHAVSRDGEDQDAAERTRELHAGRQLHPRRGARAAPLLRRRRLQLGGNRQRRRRRQADRRVDRHRQRAERSRRRRHPPLRRALGEQARARRAHRRDARPALRDALAAPRARDRAAAADEPALRPACGQGCGLRREERLGTRELLSRDRRAGGAASSAHARQARLAARRRPRAARDAAGGRALRPDLVRQDPPPRARRARAAAAAVRERDGRRAGTHGLHADAERARRLRERRDRHAARRSTAS